MAGAAGDRAINRLLVANRGEIAVRIARTARRLGIDTVGVYAEPDADALHVDAVDLAVALGGRSPAESYLRADAVLEAALATGCDAVHPGYGFLAERADFARQVVDAGLVWVGPTAEQIALLGDKVAAKRAAADAGVPTTPVVDAEPGTVPEGVVFPALVKAAAGGGGRGMRVVRTSDELLDAIEAASREADSAFGDGTVFIEPFIEDGRHIEVQILGDTHGAVVHLGERECSIQRRNQKIVEEAPAPGISDDVRQLLCESAVALARHVGYENAGTVEFLVGADGTITFLEVNTRLQVEHPVTEAVTSLDLVELQLRVASGERLPFGQDDITVDGHAIEVRLVAEDPAGGWLPAGGRLRSFEVDGPVRVDAGVRTGSLVSAEYDSLLAKVISHAPTRVGAARLLAKSLRGARLAGVTTNRALLVSLLDEPDFLAGRTPTSYLDDHPDLLAAPGPRGDDRVALLLGAVFARERLDRAADGRTGFAPSGWRNLRTQGQRQVWLVGDERHPVEYVIEHDTARVRLGAWPEPTDDGSLAEDDRRQLTVRLLRRSAREQVLEIDGVRRVIGCMPGDVERGGTTPPVMDTWSSAGSLSWQLEPRFAAHDTELAGSGPVSPLPGTVTAVQVEAGQHVDAGATLVVVEAMKMEHAIKAAGAGTVSVVHFVVGDRVDAGDLLVSLDLAESQP